MSEDDFNRLLWRCLRALDASYLPASDSATVEYTNGWEDAMRIVGNVLTGGGEEERDEEALDLKALLSQLPKLRRQVQAVEKVCDLLEKKDDSWQRGIAASLRNALKVGD